MMCSVLTLFLKKCEEYQDLWCHQGSLRAKGKETAREQNIQKHTHGEMNIQRTVTFTTMIWMKNSVTVAKYLDDGSFS